MHDAAAIARLVTLLGYELAEDDVPERLSRLRDMRASVLLAELDGVIVGLATMHPASVINRDGDIAWLTALVVDTGVRGRGVGRALVDAVETRARELGCERLSVTTHEHMTDARAFYERVGLEPTGRRFGKMLRGAS